MTSPAAGNGARVVALALFLVLLAFLNLAATAEYAKTFHYDSLNNLGDLYPRWYGSRELIVYGRNPYDAAVTAEIQAAYPQGAREGGLAFSYPLYVGIFLWPWVKLPFAAVRLAFLPILAAVMACGVACSLKIAGFALSWRTLIAGFAFTACALPAVLALELEQLTLLALAFLAGAALALLKRRPVLAGVLAACSTIKPQLAFFPLAWLCFWCGCNWRPGKRFLLGLFAGFLVLEAWSEFFLRGWFRYFIDAISRYTGYSLSTPLAVKLFGGIAGAVVIALAVAVLCVFSYQARKASSGGAFGFVFALSLVVATLAMPSAGGYAYNLVLLLPALALLARIWNELSRVSQTALLTPFALPALAVPLGHLGLPQPWRATLLALILTAPALTFAVMLIYRRQLCGISAGVKNSGVIASCVA